MKSDVRKGAMMFIGLVAVCVFFVYSGNKVGYVALGQGPFEKETKCKLEPAHGRYFRGTPSIGSPLVGIHVRVGERVKKGQRLISMLDELVSPKKFEHALAAATLAEESLAIQVKNMDSIFTRSKNAGSAISKEEHHRAELTLRRLETDLRRAAAQVKQASAELDVARVQHSNCFIHAPFDGVVTSIPGKLGSVINYPDEGSQYVWIEVIDPSVLEVVCDLKPNAADKITKGQMVRLTQNGGEWQGKVLDVSIAADPKTGLVPVRIEVPQKEKGVQLRCWTEVSVHLP